MSTLQEFVINHGADHVTLSIDTSWPVGKLKETVANKLRLKNLSLHGLNIDDLPLSSLRFSPSHHLVVIEPNSDHRDFAVAHVSMPSNTGSALASFASTHYKETGLPLCPNCTELTKRVMELTNLLFLHDHSSCRGEAAALRFEIDRLDKIIKSGASASTMEALQAKIIQMERDHKASIALIEAEKRSEIDKIRLEMRQYELACANHNETEKLSERFKIEMEKLKKERDSLRVQVYKLEKDIQNAEKELKENEEKKATFAKYRQANEALLTEKDELIVKLKKQCEAWKDQMTLVELEAKRRQENQENDRGWQEKYSIMEKKYEDAIKAAAQSENSLQSIREYEKLYSDAISRTSSLEKEVLIGKEWEVRAGEANARNALLEKEVRLLRGWEGKYKEAQAHLIVIEKQVLAMKEWEGKCLSLEKSLKEKDEKIVILHQQVAEHAFCSASISSLTAEKNRLQKEKEIRKKIIEEARISFAKLNGNKDYGCDWQDGKTGAIVTKIKPVRAAELSGLQEKDVVIQVGNEATQNKSLFLRALSKYNVGEFVPLLIIRGQKGKKVLSLLEVTAGSASREEIAEVKRRMAGGVTDEEINNTINKELGLPVSSSSTATPSSVLTPAILSSPLPTLSNVISYSQLPAPQSSLPAPNPS